MVVIQPEIISDHEANVYNTSEQSTAANARN